MAFRWRADDGPTLNVGLVALWLSGDPDQYCEETLYFRDFSGGGGLVPMHPFWIQACGIAIRSSDLSMWYLVSVVPLYRILQFLHRLFLNHDIIFYLDNIEKFGTR